MAYYYFKRDENSPSPVQLTGPKSPKAKKPSVFWRFSSFGLVGAGLFFLANASLPILFYGFKSTQFDSQIVSPVVFGETLVEMDYDNPRNWFPVAPQLPPRPVRITHYALSVPKLGIKEAVVQIGGEDLMESLIHYTGTGLPGQFGNAVIFGHSVLPQFYDPKNYKTIFSTLPTLKEGDEIFVNFDGILYRYQVIQMKETTPEDVTVLEQRYDDSYISLITCVPPGTYLRRLLVTARLMNV